MRFTLLDQLNACVDKTRLLQLGEATGIDGSATPIAMSAALPALLAALNGAAQRPGGAEALFARVSGQDDAALGTQAGDLDADHRDASACQGIELLDTLTGLPTTSRLSEGLARFAGIGADQAATLLGLLVPLVIGTLRVRVIERQLDADALAGALLDQRSEFAAAMPAGFTDQLKALGFFEPTIGERPPIATPSANSATSATPRPRKRETLAWVITLLVLLLLAYAGMRFIGERAADADASYRSSDADRLADRLAWQSPHLGHRLPQ